ncbi:hypothetical protein Tco_1315874 [Tanacetum coccineum]
MHKKFQMSSMGELTFFLGLKVTQKDDGIFISQDKYVDEILKKLIFKLLMIGSLMYLTASRPNIMFVVCAYTRFQVTPKVSHLHAVKRIFRYLKGQPKLGLWYPKDSPFDLKAYTDSDYAAASLDKKSTTRCSQFLGKRLISWQCKKQTIVANSTTEAEYVVASSCCGQVLWIENQSLDYGYNFMNIKIFIDNESTIYIVKNPVFYSKTKHIEIRHHFIRDSNEKKLIQMIKIHTEQFLLINSQKLFDVGEEIQITDCRIEVKTGSEGFQEIVDFLNGSQIRYALTKSPTIYVSLIEKFWQTTTVRTVNNGEQEITATVDGKEFTITEASVRRHLQLADVDEPILNVVSSSHQKTQTPRQALNQVTKLPQTSEPIPNVPDEAAYEEWDDRVERATTTAASLDVEQASGNINRTQSTTIHNVPLPQGIGAGGSPRCQEAIGGSIAQTRSERVPTPPCDSPLTRVHTLGSDEGNDEEDSEDSSKQGRMIEEIDQDASELLWGLLRHREKQPYCSSGISTAKELVSTTGVSMPVSIARMVQEVNISIPSPVIVKDKDRRNLRMNRLRELNYSKN